LLDRLICRSPVLLALGHRLGDHVQTLAEHVARHEGVVGADVLLLRQAVLQVVAGLEEELAHLDIGRQAGTAQVLDVLEVRVVLEHPLDQRCQEVLLQLALAAGHLQAQRREDGQVPRGVGLDGLVEPVDEGIGLADAQRQAQHDGPVDPGQHGLHGGVERMQSGGHDRRLLVPFMLRCTRVNGLDLGHRPRRF
jgi:hypothetical protein